LLFVFTPGPPYMFLSSGFACRRWILMSSHI
jgi:hypothetical protein